MNQVFKTLIIPGPIPTVEKDEEGNDVTVVLEITFDESTALERFYSDFLPTQTESLCELKSTHEISKIIKSINPNFREYLWLEKFLKINGYKLELIRDVTPRYLWALWPTQ